MQIMLPNKTLNLLFQGPRRRREKIKPQSWQLNFTHFLLKKKRPSQDTRSNYLNKLNLQYISASESILDKIFAFIKS